jgi:hypothetical protein
VVSGISMLQQAKAAATSGQLLNYMIRM